MKALIFDDRQRLLVVQTADGMWELPGGGWEHDETMQDCLRREVKEEIGVDVAEVRTASAYPYSSRGRSRHMRLKLALPVTLASHDFSLIDQDIQAYRYVTKTELIRLPMVDSEAGIKAHADAIWAEQTND